MTSVVNHFLLLPLIIGSGLLLLPLLLVVEAGEYPNDPDTESSGWIPRSNTASRREATEAVDSNALNITNLWDIRVAAEDKLPEEIFDYIDGGGWYELTRYWNAAANKQVRLHPRYLRGQGQAMNDPSVTSVILGRVSRMPIGFAPTAYHSQFTADGELATARACEELGTVYTVSFYASKTPEQIASVASKRCRKWQNLYPLRNRTHVREIVKRVAAAGYEALVLTIDGSNLGRRYRDRHHGLDFSVFPLPALIGPLDPEGDIGDNGAGWDYITWLTGLSKLPVIVKGILEPYDALQAMKAGARGIYVSNHGGRELDTVPATIEVLPDIAKIVREFNRNMTLKDNGKKGSGGGSGGGTGSGGGSQNLNGLAGGGQPTDSKSGSSSSSGPPAPYLPVDVYTDGGYRTGIDAIKAFAYGANAIFLGRPVPFGLAYNGTDGVVKTVKIVHDELKALQQLLGVYRLNEIYPSLVQNKVAREKEKETYSANVLTNSLQSRSLKGL